MPYIFKLKFPKPDQLVMAIIESEEKDGVYVILPEYNNTRGFIAFTEVSRKKKKDVDKIIKIGNNVVMIVLRSDEKKGCIDLSKFNIKDSEIVDYTAKMKLHKELYNLFRYIFFKLKGYQDIEKIDEEELYSFLSDTLFEIQEKTKLENEDIEDIIIFKDIKDRLLDKEKNIIILDLVNYENLYWSKSNIKEILDHYIDTKINVKKETDTFNFKMLNCKPNGNEILKFILDYKSFESYPIISKDIDIKITRTSASNYSLTLTQLECGVGNIKESIKILLEEIKKRDSMKPQLDEKLFNQIKPTGSELESEPEQESEPDLLNNKQSYITVGFLGRVSNGKTTMARAMTNKDPMKFKKEIIENKTIKLGYSTLTIYKCPNCPEPDCYQSNIPVCEICETVGNVELKLDVLDAPGHSEYQTTALSGAINMDYSLLVISADCGQDLETNEHYKYIKYLGLNDRTIGIQNKVDLVSIVKASEQFEEIKNIYDLKYIIPFTFKYKKFLQYLLMYLIKTIPNPINEELYKKINEPLRASIIRSFDPNKPGIDISEMKGAVIGCSIKKGCIRVGDKIKIIPGVIQKDGKCIELEAFVQSIRTNDENLTVAYPGGNIGIELSLDSSLSKEDRLVGNFIVSIGDTTHRKFKNCIIKYTNFEESNFDLKQNDICVCMLGTTKRDIKILGINKEKQEINFISNIDMAGILGDLIIITKNGKIILSGLIVHF
jgi:translation initiation factor 2 subunit 3